MPGLAHAPTLRLTGSAIHAAARTVSGCPQTGNAVQDVGRLITVDADCLGMEEPEEAPRNPLQAKRRRRALTKVKRLRDIGTLSENIPVSGETSEGSQSAGGKRKPAGAGQAGMPAPKKPKMSAPQDDDSSAWEPTAVARSASKTLAAMKHALSRRDDPPVQHRSPDADMLVRCRRAAHRASGNAPDHGWVTPGRRGLPRGALRTRRGLPRTRRLRCWAGSHAV